MAVDIDSTSHAACKSGNPAVFPFSQSSFVYDLSVLRDMCASVQGMTLDHVYLILVAIDEYGGRRELGDLVDMIDDARWPVRIIEAMIEYGLIRFAPGCAFDSSIPVERIC